jgi:hypothetical protein
MVSDEYQGGGTFHDHFVGSGSGGPVHHSGSNAFQGGIGFQGGVGNAFQGGGGYHHSGNNAFLGGGEGLLREVMNFYIISNDKCVGHTSNKKQKYRCSYIAVACTVVRAFTC